MRHLLTGQTVVCKEKLQYFTKIARIHVVSVKPSVENDKAGVHPAKKYICLVLF